MTPESFTGVIVIDKPAGWTSHDVVNKVRRIAGTKKVGHLGTLDPMATGVLPLLIGRATRLAKFFNRSDKVYEGTVRFGCATDTYDREGTPAGPDKDVQLDRTTIEDHLASMRGRILQTPPAVSAKKIGGTPAYKLARQNVVVTLDPVEVEIFALDLLRCGGREIDIHVHCGTGTYVRSIAHDLGVRTGAGAYLDRLRRLASGPFTIERACTLDRLQELAQNQRLREALIPAADLLPEFPAEFVDSLTAGFIRQGRDFRVSPFRATADARFVKAVSREGELIAIGEARLPHVYHPVLVL